jgi:hypothetical protein
VVEMRIVRSLVLALVAILGLSLGTATTATADPLASSVSEGAPRGTTASTDPEDPGIPPTP